MYPKAVYIAQLSYQQETLMLKCFLYLSFYPFGCMKQTIPFICVITLAVYYQNKQSLISGEGQQFELQWLIVKGITCLCAFGAPVKTTDLQHVLRFQD